MRPLALLDQRGQYLEASARCQFADLIGDLLCALCRHAPSAVGAVKLADSGEEHAQVVHHLGGRAHGRSGIAAHRLLLDGDGWAQTADEVHLRFLGLPQELANV